MNDNFFARLEGISLAYRESCVFDALEQLGGSATVMIAQRVVC